ncbi:nucleotidyltransferase domain-containing protein [Geothermobacter hydrogeniphilus]|uniref:nucleotidyltransferase domain-containing protein n=1 Tax=Geothermobacter hydrogeniphilus TaxID=1969733 RepID=UPI001C0B7494|nr:nucleotidyltransferase domain-containing protein [Geothermobacter hydrogeniphilus]
MGTIQTELKKLTRLGLVSRRKDGNRLYYSARREHPLFRDIQGMVLKTAGLVEVLKNAVAGRADIEMAFVFGSVARQEEQAESDIDLLVIGRIGLRELIRALSGLAGQLGREINPHVFSVEEFVRRKLAGDHFLTRVLEDGKLFVKGTADDLEKLG